jgi:NAD(P)-dependent dehydrogenase (short-subunit alcohol dehydrogenase family)
MWQINLEGRSALVTGASSGFGRRFATILAAQGAEVYAAARRTDELDRLVSEIEAAGGRARAIRLDVSDQGAVTDVVAELSSLDIVVNNAGVAASSRAIDCPEDEWRKVYDINLHGAFFVAQQSARRMQTLGHGGSIINIASITGLRPSISAAAYASSKAALIQMTKAHALEWARFGIRVNALAPGYFETDLNRDFLRSEYGQAMMKRIPQRRFGAESDLDGVLLLLASDASAYMTGSIITVDGGHVVSAL